MVNWLNKLYEAGSRIKAAINKRRATKEELAQSNYVSCCVGLVSKKELADNFHCCPHCSKHFKITPAQRFQYLFDSGIYETFKTPISGVFIFLTLPPIASLRSWAPRHKPK